MGSWFRLALPYIYSGSPNTACGAFLSAMKFRNLNSRLALTGNVRIDPNEIFPTENNRDTLISDELKLMEKLTKMASDGCNQLQVISDFDHTISMYRDGSTYMLTTHEALEMHPAIKDTTLHKLRELRSHFLPLETDPQVSPSVRRENLELWWNTSHKILISEPVTKKMIAEVQEVAPIALRKDFVTFSTYLHDLEIPLTIFSAGLGDVILQILHNAHIPMNTVNVVANFLQFDHNGNACAFVPPTIHSQNKTLSTMFEMNASNQTRAGPVWRPNVILLGDSAHDIHMTAGHRFSSVLKIGFLNQPTTSRIEEYTRLYDIVLLKQESFNIPCKLLKWICSVTKRVP